MAYTYPTLPIAQMPAMPRPTMPKVAMPTVQQLPVMMPTPTMPTLPLPTVRTPGAIAAALQGIAKQPPSAETILAGLVANQKVPAKTDSATMQANVKNRLAAMDIPTGAELLARAKARKSS